MTRTKTLALVALAALTLLAVPWGSARADVIVGVRAPYPPRYYYRHRYYRPYVVVAPPPVYVAPRPVYIAPRPVIVTQPPVYVSPAAPPLVVTPAPTYVQPVPVAPAPYPRPY